MSEEERVMRDFLRWGAAQTRERHREVFPGGTIGYWVAEYLKDRKTTNSPGDATRF